MALKESGYIRSGLTYAKGIGEPMYTDDDYQSGAYIENGFPVENEDAEPEHIVVQGPQYVVDNSDMDSRFREAENHVPEHVIHLGNTLTYLPPTDPDYALSPDERRSEKAKAIAEAVRLAVERGEIDADLFDAD